MQGSSPLRQHQNDLDPAQARRAAPAPRLSGEGLLADISILKDRGSRGRAGRGSRCSRKRCPLLLLPGCPAASRGFVKRQEVQDPFNEFTQPSEYQVFVFLRLERKAHRCQQAPSWGAQLVCPQFAPHQRPFAPGAPVSSAAPGWGDRSNPQSKPCHQTAPLPPRFELVPEEASGLGRMIFEEEVALRALSAGHGGWAWA